MRIKRVFLMVLLAAGCGIARGEETNPAAASLAQAGERLANLERQLNARDGQLREQLAKLETRMDKMSAKLGSNFERSGYSSYDTLERKLEDIIRRIEKLERTVADMERQNRSSGSRR